MPRDKEVVLDLLVNDTQAVNSIQSFEKDMKAFSSLLSNTTNRSRALNEHFQKLANIQRQYYATLSNIVKTENARNKAQGEEKQKVIDAENKLNKALDTQANLELKLAKATEDRIRAQQQLDKAKGLNTPEAIAIKKEIEELTLLQTRLSKIKQYRGKAKTDFLNDAAKYNLNAGQKRNEIEAELNRLLEERKVKLHELTNSFAIEQEIKKLEHLVEELDKVGVYKGTQKTNFLGTAADLGYSIDTDMNKEEVRNALINLITEHRAELLKLGEAVTVAQMKYDRLTKAEELARAKFEEQNQKVEEAKNEYSQLNAELENTQKELEETYNKAQNENIDNLTNQAQAFNRELTQATGQAALDKISGTVRTIVSDFKKLVNTARKFIETIGKVTGLSLATKEIKDNLFATNKINWNKAIRQIVQYGFGFRSLFFLVRRVRSAIKEGFEYLGGVQKSAKKAYSGASEEVNKLIRTLKELVAYLKSATAAMLQPFVPLINVVLPRLVSWFDSATTSAARFIATITGQKYIYRASTDMEDYANVIDSVSGSAKEAKKQLAEFDDIDVLDDKKSKSGSGGYTLDTSGWFSLEELEPSNLAELIKKAWSSENIAKAFEEIGKYIGEALSTSLEDALKKRWSKVRNKARKLGAAIAGTINGIFKTNFIDNLAKNIGEGINTAIDYLYNFWTMLNGVNIGAKLYNAVAALIDTIDWNKVGWYIGEKFNTIIEGIAAFIGDGDNIKKIFDHISKSLKYILSTTKWGKLGSSLSSIITSLAQGITKLLQENKEELQRAIASFVRSFDTPELRESLGELFVTLISTSLQSAATIINNSKTLQGVITGFFAFEGVKIAGTLLIGKLIKDAIVAAIAGGATGVTAVASSTLGIIIGVTGIVALSINAFRVKVNDNPAEETAQSLSEILPEEIYVKFSAEFVTGNYTPETLSEVLEYLGVDIPEDIGTIANDADAVTSLLSLALEKYKTFGSSVDTTATKIDETYSKLENMSDEDFIANLVQPLNGDKDEILETWSELKDGIVGNWSEIKEGVTTNADTIKEKTDTLATDTKTSFNTITTNFETMINNVIDGVNHLTTELGKLPNSYRDAFGIQGYAPILDKLTLPKLATGGVIPPNKPFLAMLGDQKKGTNIEAPLDTIVSAMQQALGGMNLVGVGGQDIVLNIDGSELARITVPNNLRELNRKGYNIRVLEKK